MPPVPHEILRQLVQRPSPTVFDVGANLGQSTATFLGLFEGCRVHAFEPQAALFEAMRQRIGGIPAVTLNQAAMGAAPGTATLHRTTHCESSSLLPLNRDSWWAQALHIAPEGEETVAVEAIDHYCATRGIESIDLLKLDTQGFEPECLRGALDMLRARRIGVIQAELVYHALYSRTTRFADLENLLYPLGYRLFTMFDVRVGDRTGELLSLDTVFVQA